MSEARRSRTCYSVGEVLIDQRMKRATASKLLACPFCGGQPSIERSFSGGPYVLCGGCGAATMFATNSRLASDLWNNRAQVQ